jgi:hypothetical protein
MAHRALLQLFPLCLHFRVRLDTCPGKSDDEKKLEIASKEEKEKTGKFFYGVLGTVVCHGCQCQPRSVIGSCGSDSDSRMVSQTYIIDTQGWPSARLMGAISKPKTRVLICQCGVRVRHVVLYH